MEDEEGVELGILDLSDSILIGFWDFFSAFKVVAEAVIVSLAPSVSRGFSNSRTKINGSTDHRGGS